MSITTFPSNGSTYKITVETALTDGKEYPVLLFVHGNAGLTGRLGTQIRAFASRLAAKGYNTAIPQYYLDDSPHYFDFIPKPDILADAIDAVSALPTVDANRIGLIGYSLGATTSMSLIAAKPSDTISVFVNYFGFLTPTIHTAVAKFPPTTIFHNERDLLVNVKNARDLDSLLPSTVEHKYQEYSESYRFVNHTFKPGGFADTDSQARTIAWCERYLPPTGT